MLIASMEKDLTGAAVSAEDEIEIAKLKEQLKEAKKEKNNGKE